MVLTAFYRSIIFYLFLLVVIRLMGKREVGNLAPIDFVVTIMIAELAVLPIENADLPILVGIVPILTLVLLELGITALSLRNRKWRELINGRPSILVRDGKLVAKEMKRERYTIDDLLEQLRRKGITNVADVEIAILETDGYLSAIPKSQKRPLTPKDINVPTQYEGLPYLIITDGEVEYANLKTCGLDLTWLQSELQRRGIHDVKDVLCAILDTNGELFVQRKGESHWYVQE